MTLLILISVLLHSRFHEATAALDMILLTTETFEVVFVQSIFIAFRALDGFAGEVHLLNFGHCNWAGLVWQSKAF